MSEKDIIKELRANGPMMFDFEATHEFQIFKSGVLTDSKLDVTHMMNEQEKRLLSSD
jgi:hypothetical protein